MSFDGWEPASVDGGPAAARQERERRRADRRRWWAMNRSLRFYGIVFLAGTKAADALTTAVALQFLPGVVELNPFASSVFVGNGLFTGLAVMSVATVIVTVVVAELLAVQIRLRLGMDRLALITKTAIYVVLSGWFGLVAISNALLVSEQVQSHFFGMFALVG